MTRWRDMSRTEQIRYQQDRSYRDWRSWLERNWPFLLFAPFWTLFMLFLLVGIVR